jgi:hypothetical protein
LQGEISVTIARGLAIDLEEVLGGFILAPHLCMLLQDTFLVLYWISLQAGL